MGRRARENRGAGVFEAEENGTLVEKAARSQAEARRAHQPESQAGAPHTRRAPPGSCSCDDALRSLSLHGTSKHTQ